MKTIEELAREAGYDLATDGFAFETSTHDLFHRFASLVRAEALEEACKIIWGQCSSDTEAQRTVAAIRKAKDAK